MPTYEYHCPTNDRVVTVVHRMSEEIHTWGELCMRAGIPEDGTPAESTVAKKIGLSILASSRNMGCDARPPIEDAPARPGPLVNPNAW
jgi:hypothetical protein